MGSFVWGASGRLDCYPFSTDKLEQLMKNSGYLVENKCRKQFMTYKNYPFIVLEKDDIQSY
jgi:hypothetical protein